MSMSYYTHTFHVISFAQIRFNSVYNLLIFNVFMKPLIVDNLANTCGGHIIKNHPFEGAPKTIKQDNLVLFYMNIFI